MLAPDPTIVILAGPNGDPVLVRRGGRPVDLDQQEIARLIEDLTRQEAPIAPQAA